MSATIRTATPTVTYYQKLAEQFSAELDDVAALIPDLESPHPLTANFVRSHVNVPFDFLHTAIFAVEQVPDLRSLNKLDADAARATLQFIEAFRPVYDKLMRLARSLKFTMSSRKAHLAADALQIYWIGRGLARDPGSSDVVPIVAALKRDLGRRGPGKARRRAASAGEVVEAEPREQLAPPDARDRQLVPSETGEREAAAESSGGLDVDAEGLEGFAPRGGRIIPRCCEARGLKPAPRGLKPAPHNPCGADLNPHPCGADLNPYPCGADFNPPRARGLKPAPHDCREALRPPRALLRGAARSRASRARSP